MILENQVGIFIHNPKSGGVSLSKALEKYCPRTLEKHATALHLKLRLNIEDWNRLYKIVWIRDPWERIASSYAYQNIGPIKDFKKWLFECKKNNGKNYMGRPQNTGFDNDINDISHKRNLMSQFNWVSDLSKNIIVDFIGKLENIEEDFKKVCDKLDLNLKLDHKNKSTWIWINQLKTLKEKKEYYRQFYTSSDMIDYVASISQWEINKFNYKF